MEDFVSFEISKKLKEKGFREECLAYYTSEYTLYTNKVVLCDDKYLEIAEIDYEECLYSFNTQKDRLLRTIVDAPTISQVLKWLRDEKKLYVSVTYLPKDVNYKDFYYASIQRIGYYRKTIYTNDSYDNWEEAALNGIEYAIDNNLIP